MARVELLSRASAYVLVALALAGLALAGACSTNLGGPSGNGDAGGRDGAFLDGPVRDGSGSTDSSGPASDAGNLADDTGICLACCATGVAGGWKTVSIGHGQSTPCDDPVVIVGPPTRNGPAGGVVRLRNVAPNGFEIRFQEWGYLDDWHPEENVSFLVLERGRHRMSDGSIWEVGELSLGGTLAWNGVSFSEAFPGPPAVFLTVQTANGGAAVTARVRSTTSTGFEVALSEQESLQNGHTAESVGYLAVYQPAGSGTVNTYWSGVKDYQVGTSVHGDSWAPSAVSAPGSNDRLLVQEEQSADEETGHGDEPLSVLAAGGQLFAQLGDGDLDNATLRRDRGLSATCGHLMCDPSAPCGDPDEPDGCGGTKNCSCGPIHLVDNLADPDVLKVHDDLFFLSGTRNPQRLPIYRSSNLIEWDFVGNYDPLSANGATDYCWLWAPELTNVAPDGSVDGRYYIYFSARTFPAGGSCPAPDEGGQVTTFYAVAEDESLDFGPPNRLDTELLPIFSTEQSCAQATGSATVANCEKVIRIDAAVLDSRSYGPGGEPWFYWVWFYDGNNISGVRMKDPGGGILRITRPEEAFEYNLPEHGHVGINEAATAFLRNGKYFLFFSTSGFRADYAMHYLVADSPAQLVRQRSGVEGRILRRYSAPLVIDGRRVENHGHNVVVGRKGEYYNLFHKGYFDASGAYDPPRDTFLQRLVFEDNESIYSMNAVNVRWSRLAGYEYSLDLATKGGAQYGPCINAGRIGTGTSATYRGYCPSAGSVDNRPVVPKAEVESFRLYYKSPSQEWGQSGIPSVEVAYDGASDEVFIPLPGGSIDHVALSWNEKQSNAVYSLDVKRGGSWIAPCVNAGVLGQSLDYTFDGTCVSAGGQSVSFVDVESLRICSSNDGWQSASCGSVAYDGQRKYVRVHIP